MRLAGEHFVRGLAHIIVDITVSSHISALHRMPHSLSTDSGPRWRTISKHRSRASGPCISAIVAKLSSSRRIAFDKLQYRRTPFRHSRIIRLIHSRCKTQRQSFPSVIWLVLSPMCILPCGSPHLQDTMPHRARKPKFGIVSWRERYLLK